MSNNANAFMSNFAAGFSFVDDIKRNRRNEARLDKRLARLQEEQDFQRARQRVTDQRATTLFEQQQQDRVSERGDIERAREGDVLALDPNTPDEVLSSFADVSGGAREELSRRNKQARLTDAANEIQNLRNSVTASPNGPSLSEAVTQPTGPIVDPATATGRSGGESQFVDESRAASSLRRVSEDDIRAIDPQYQEKGFFGRAGQDLAGTVQQGTRAVGNVVESLQGVGYNAMDSVTSAVTGNPKFNNGPAPGPRAVGAALSGDTFVPADFKTKGEIAQITDLEARQAATARNVEILGELRARSQNPERNKLARPLTDQGALQEGGELLRDEMQRAENEVVRRYEEYHEGTDSALEQLALEDPGAVAVDYFQNRATLADVKGQEFVDATDRRMQPVLERYAAVITGELAGAAPGSVQERQLRTKQANVLASINEIADSAPSVANAANINSSGYKIGDADRGADILTEVYDPNRPARTSTTPTSLNAAAAVAGRIAPGKRLNDKQIQSIAILADAGWMDKATAQSLLLTGHFPPGKSPNDIKKTVKAGETTYAITEGNGMFILPDVVGNRSEVKATNDRSFDQDQLDWAAQGASLMGLDEYQTRQVQSFMLDNGPVIRSMFNVNSQEGIVNMSRVVSQSFILSNAEHRRMSEDSIFALTNPDDAPTTQEIFDDPKLREELANNYEMRLVPMPPLGAGSQSDIDLDPVRKSIEEGNYGPAVQQAYAAGRMSEEDILYVWLAKNGTQEQLQRLNNQGK